MMVVMAKIKISFVSSTTRPEIMDKINNYRFNFTPRSGAFGFGTNRFCRKYYNKFEASNAPRLDYTK